MTIGIPQALLYWKQPYLWEIFFRELGIKVLLSPKTNREIAEMGEKAADSETCFSNKVYFGHLLWLDGKCDFIFVPLLKTNQDKLEYCPKFFGLPDLAKILVKTPILTETIDYRTMPLEQSIIKIGKKLGKKRKDIQEAMAVAFRKKKEMEEEKNKKFFSKINSRKRKIVLVSHPYNLYDEYVNLRIKNKLNGLDVEPIFIDEVPREKSKAQKEKMKFSLPKFHWEFGREMVEKIESVLLYNISGFIQISSFACGCDAVLKEFVEKRIRAEKIPFLYLIIDEQSGEAGFQTRLEAFIDTLNR